MSEHITITFAQLLDAIWHMEIEPLDSLKFEVEQALRRKYREDEEERARLARKMYF